MKVIINGTLNIGGINKTIIKKQKIFVQSYSFSVSPDVIACAGGFNVTIYSASSILGVGSTLYQDSQLTTPTTYTAINNPYDTIGNTYFTITGNTITSLAFCN
jgi:hypothetical protein